MISKCDTLASAAGTQEEGCGVPLTVDQHDRPNDRTSVSGDNAAPASFRSSHSDRHQPLPDAAGAQLTLPLPIPIRSSVPILNVNRRIGPCFFHSSDRLGKGVYGEVYRAYLVTSSPAMRPIDGGRVNYEEIDVTPDEVARLGDLSLTHIALKRMVNPCPADGWTAATLREIAVLIELGNLKPAEERTRLVHQSRAYFALPGTSPSRRASLRSWSGLTDFQPLTTSTTAGLSQDDDLNSFVTNSAADSSATPAQMKSLELPPAFALRRRRQLTSVQRAVKEGASSILELYKFMLDDSTGTAYLATEFCEGGDIQAFLRKQKPDDHRISDPALYKRWMRQAVQGVAFMHARHIAHRDLKPQNLLLKKRQTSEMNLAHVSSPQNEHPGFDYDLKVGDFGLSRVEDIPIKKYEHEAITLGYRPPDALLGNLYLHFASDVWSLGCILLETASGQPMFRGRDDRDQLRRVLLRLGGFDKDSFPSAFKYAHTATHQALLTKITLHQREELARESYQRHLEREMKSLREQEKSYSPVFAEYAAKQELRHVAIIRLHLRDYFTRHPGLDVLGEEGLDVVSRMLMLEPSLRLTLEGALAHPFFAIDTADGDLNDDVEFMEVHDYDEGAIHRAPWMTSLETETVKGQPAAAASSPGGNSGGRPPTLFSRPAGTPGQSTPVVSEGAASSTVEKGAAPPSTSAATRPSASYVLPPYISQQQQRLSHSASELRVTNANGKTQALGAVAGGSTSQGSYAGPFISPAAGSTTRHTTTRTPTNSGGDGVSRPDIPDQDE